MKTRSGRLLPQRVTGQMRWGREQDRRCRLLWLLLLLLPRYPLV